MLRSIRIYLSPLLILTFVLITGLSSAAQAQTVIRDREIERVFSKWFEPVIEAAGLRPDNVNIILIQDSQINAFVAGGPNVFLFTGLLLETQDPSEILGVLAHELGHIRGGHLIRGRQALERASYEALIGTILGLGAAIASGDGAAAGAISSGTQSQAMRRFLSHSRVQESSADQAALTYLNKAGMSPKGLISFFDKLKEKESVVSSRQSEYSRTHPLTDNRIAALKSKARASPHYSKPLPQGWKQDYERVMAKLLGFIHPGHVAWTYSLSNRSIPAQYARAIAAYRTQNFEESLAILDTLIKSEPENAYFYELKGQVLVDAGRLEEAIAPYQKAVGLDPKAGLIRIALAQALIEIARSQNSTETSRLKITQAINHLTQASKSEKRSGRLHRLLATAYGQIGKTGLASYHLGEEAVLRRKWKDAETHARSALRALPPESREHLKAQDLLEFIEIHKKG